MTTLQFLGATGTVTGSKYLIAHGGFGMLVDSGLDVHCLDQLDTAEL